MRWFRNRLGDEIFERYPDVTFLRDDYPRPEDYLHFQKEKMKNIYGFSFIDFEAAYMSENDAWLVRLTEPDNGNEKLDVHGRNFTTELFVYKLDASVALGIRESCREPEANTIDAAGYRPGFVRDMFYDEDLLITEFGIDKKYSFSSKPIILNGKSGEACEEIYRDLIASSYRQQPILFIPGEYYKDNAEEVDKKTKSLLGFAHVVVWEGSAAKLFGQIMENDDLLDVANEGQLVFYRTSNHQEYPSDYYESDIDNLLDDIKTLAQKDPCRKHVDFKDFAFKPSWWELNKPDKRDEIKADIKELSNVYEKKLSDLKIQFEDLGRDNDILQRRLDKLESENKKLDKENAKTFSDICRYKDENERFYAEIEELKNKLRKNEAEKLQEEIIHRGIIDSEKERYKPIINLPSVTKDIKDNLLAWVEKYYSDTIEIHPKAVRSLKDDNRNIDWHRLCMMIHYLSGYTIYRNGGGAAINLSAAREYDPEESGYTVEPVSSGHGSTELFKDKYTITVNGKDVIMDMHIKYGKGLDANMIRVYFYYDPDAGKTIIGYMPGHLPTRADTH